MGTQSNQQLWNSIADFGGSPLIIKFNKEFNAGYCNFRNVTSEQASHNGQQYPVVYLSNKDYAGLSIYSSDNTALRLIVNLEYYYVYGFYIDQQVYAYKGESTDYLRDHGFDIPDENVIPYGDSYTDIKSGLSDEQFEAILATQVTLSALDANIVNIVDTSKSWLDKNGDLLRVFWSLVEGIRFSAISDTVNNLVAGGSSVTSYQDFYDYAENWSTDCVAAADAGQLNPAIAVYDLHKLGVPA